LCPFNSDATNLDPDDTYATDVYVKDLLSGNLVLASVPVEGRARRAFSGPDRTLALKRFLAPLGHVCGTRP